MGLSMIDYAVWWQLMALSLGIGIYIKVNYKLGKHIFVDPVDDFILASRKLGILPVASSIMSAFLTSISIMGAPANFFKYGITPFVEAGGFLWTIIPVAFLFAPLYEKLPIITVYEYIGWRFNNSVRLVSLALFLIRTELYISGALIMPVKSFAKILDGNHWLLMVVTVSLAVVFTALGGMRAVAWSNVFQLFLCILFPLTMMAAEIPTNNTLTAMFVTPYYTNRYHLVFGFDMDEKYSFLSMSVGYGFAYMATYSTHQVVIQQLLSLKDKKNIKITLILTMMAYCFYFVLLFLMSVMIAYNYVACDPVKGGIISDYDDLLSQYMVKRFSHTTGLTGPTIAALFGTTLSTISSAVLSMATVTLNDAILIYRKDLSPKQKVILMQLFIVLYGVITVGVAVLMSIGQSSIGIINIQSQCASHITLFFMAWCLPCVNSYGALAGFLVSDVFVNVLHFLRYKLKYSYRVRPSSIGDCQITDEWIANHNDTPADLSGLYIFQRLTLYWEVLMAVTLGIFVGCIVSCQTNKRVDIKDRKVDSRLISPLVHKWFKSYLKFSKDAYVRPEELEKRPNIRKSKRRTSYKPETKEEIIN